MLEPSLCAVLRSNALGYVRRRHGERQGNAAVAVLAISGAMWEKVLRKSKIKPLLERDYEAELWNEFNRWSYSVCNGKVQALHVSNPSFSWAICGSSLSSKIISPTQLSLLP
jgi:hypothetical protein